MIDAPLSLMLPCVYFFLCMLSLITLSPPLSFCLVKVNAWVRKSEESGLDGMVTMLQTVNLMYYTKHIYVSGDLCASFKELARLSTHIVYTHGYTRTNLTGAAAVRSGCAGERPIGGPYRRRRRPTKLARSVAGKPARGTCAWVLLLL
jgi:hypothetical protein